MTLGSVRAQRRDWLLSRLPEYIAGHADYRGAVPSGIEFAGSIHRQTPIETGA
jgi:hypothetical protein